MSAAPQQSFNPAAFMAQSVQGASSTKRNTIPEGVYPFITEAVVPENMRLAQGKKDPSKWYLFLDLKLRCQLPPEIAVEYGDTVGTIFHSITIDRTENGSLDMGKGKNVQLGRIREAFGMNDPSRPFSFTDLGGKSGMVKVKHELYEGNPQERVDAILPLS